MSLIALANGAGFALAAAGGAAVWFGLGRRPLVLQNRRAVWIFAAVWVAVLLLEFYALGPASYIDMQIDGNVSATYFTYLNERHLGGQLTHGFGGSHDVDSILGFGTQFFSIERTLFGLLPVWLAIFVLKLCVTAVGFSGAYKLNRVTGPASRTLAAGLAAFFTVTIFYNIIATTWHGLGYAVLPWVIYLGVVRDRQRHYFLGLIALGIMVATGEPTHTFLSFAAALLAGAVLLGKANVRTVILPFAVMCLFMFANWHEVFYAMRQMAALTVRGSTVYGDLALLSAIGLSLQSFVIVKTAAVGIVGSVLILAYRKDPFFWNGVGAIAALLACYFALAWLPWEIIGLGILKSLSAHYLYFANSAICLVLVSRAVTSLETIGGENSWIIRFVQRRPNVLVFAIVAALLISYKTENLTRYVYYGSQSQFTTIENLANPDWATAEPFRVVTLRHRRPEPEVAAAFYGLDTYDGALNLPLAAYSTYWRDGILKGNDSEGFFGRLTFKREFDTGNAYDIQAQADLGLLAIANVAFIISPVPIKGDLRLVSAPDKPPARPKDGFMAFAADRFARIFRYGKVYVYALPDSLPRAFAAGAIHRVGAGVKDAVFLKTISTLALARTAVVRGLPEIFSNAGNLKTMRVRDFSKTVNGYDVVIDAPDGGVLVLNVPPMPFWTAATAAGKPLKVSPVNMVQMAVTIPAGTKSVSFRYQRPTVRSVLKEVFP